jgi:hypothetical protein
MIQDALHYYTTTATQSASSSRVHEEGIWFAPQTSVLQQPGETKHRLESLRSVTAWECLPCVRRKMGDGRR